MRVLVGCEYSGAVRDVFTALGHEAWSCDFEPNETPGNHYKGDVMDIIDDGWDLGIFHPPCTYLTVSGLHWNKRNPERAQKTEEALEFVSKLMAANIPSIAIENPVSCISSRIRKPDQIIQPYQFGEDASKKTCLWLKNLPPLAIKPELRLEGRLVEYPPGSGKIVERWSNQTDSGQNNLPPSELRWKDRSRTYKGIAEAMGLAWGSLENIRRQHSGEQLQIL